MFKVATYILYVFVLSLLFFLVFKMLIISVPHHLHYHSECLLLQKDDISDAQKDLLERRGPDGSNCIEFQLGNLHLLFHACVLHMQGSTIATQPATSATGNILLYTGEIFDGFEVIFLIIVLVFLLL